MIVNLMNQLYSFKNKLHYRLEGVGLPGFEPGTKEL